MAELRFDCPQCKQTISADELWGGHQIQCPSCQAEIAVPQKEIGGTPTPAPSPSGAHVPQPPSSGTKLSIGKPQHRPAAPTPATGQSTVFSRPPAPLPKKQSPLVKVAIWGGVVLALGAGVYFCWPMVTEYQNKANEKRRQAEKNADGGQVGHIGALYDVLDATEPGGRGLGGGTRGSGPKPRSSANRAISVDGTDGGPAGAGTNEAQLPIIPGVYSLEAATAKIPEGRVNGMISGTNFLPEIVRLDPAGSSLLLRFIQGTLAAPDREMRVYLRLKAGESLAGHTWTVTKETRGGPQVVKGWKADPKYAPKSQPYSSGYALKLELGQINEGVVPGKIFLALPDMEKSFVAGIFKAQTTISGSNAPPVTATQTATPATVAPSGGTPGEKAAFDKRYGIKR